MDLLNCTEPPVVKKLGSLVEAEAWLISFKIYSETIELICDINLNNKIYLKNYIKYKFNDCLNIAFKYNQNLFGKLEDDISNIEFVRVYEDIDYYVNGRWRAEFLFSHGKLDFSFRSFDMTISADKQRHKSR
jgi:hypothetical protein